MKKIGIYIIKNNINGKVYVGSSCNLTERKNCHFNKLRKNKHHSIKLQRSWNKHGETNFEHTIIEYTNKDNQFQSEQFWIDYFDSFNNGYNAVPLAGSLRASKLTQNHKDKIRDTLIGRIPWNKGIKGSTKGNPQYGNGFNNKNVFDTKTGIEYKSIKEASDILKINYCTLRHMLSKSKVKNKTTLIMGKRPDCPECGEFICDCDD